MQDFAGYLSVDGSRLWVEARGEGPPLLMVMGIGGHTAMWEPLLGHLPGHRTICYDAPGTGRSPAGGPRSMRSLARLAEGVLDAAGAGPASVLGYSFGGAVAQQLARQAPDKVARLVLVAASCGLGSVVGPQAWWMLTPARYWSPTLLSSLAPALYGGRQRAGALAPHFHRSPPDPVSYAAQLAAIGTWSSMPWLHRLKVPTLVVSGDDDPLVPVANARFLARRIPGARLHVVAGGGHLLLLDVPGEAAPAIAGFLAGVPDRLAG